MKEIKLLVENIREEQNDAEKYAKLALLWKEKDQRLGDMFAQLAKEELTHSARLHEQAVRLIKEQTNAGIKPPEAMQAVWDWEHERMVEEEAEVRAMLEMYKS